MTTYPTSLLWLTLALDAVNTLQSACRGLRKEGLRHLEDVEIDLNQACLDLRQSLSSGQPILAEQLILKELPALGAVFNVLLLTDEKHDPGPVLELVHGVRSQLETVFPSLCNVIEGSLELSIIFAVFGRCLWREGHAPLYTAHFPSLRQKWCCIEAPVSDRKLQQLSYDWGSCALRFVRSVLLSYSRLTVSKDRATWDEAQILRDFQSRIQLPNNCKIPLGFRTIGRCVFGTWSLEWLQSGSLPQDVFPHHGPGAVSEGNLNPAEKGQVRYAYDPALWWANELYFRAPMSFQGEGFMRTLTSPFRLSGNEDCSRVILVPKDYRGPRIIAAEPAIRQYLQEAVKDYFYKKIRMSPLSGAIDFEHADKNAQAALRGSNDRKIATLDLKDASDHVRVWHVSELFQDVPNVLEYLMALRTGRVRIGESRFDISTFATMGSSLTFPVETIVITCLLVAGLWDKVMSKREYITPSNIRKAIRRAKIRVYGDDVIVRRDLALLSMSVLESAGLPCNSRKCCYRTFFRESCGCDAIRGYRVDVPRPRDLPGAMECTLDGIVQLANLFAQRNFIATSMALIAIAQKTWHKTIPITKDRKDVPPGVVSSTQLWSCVTGEYKPHRWNKALQRAEYIAWKPKNILLSHDPWYRRYWDSLASVSELPEGNTSPGYAVADRRHRIQPIRFDSHTTVSRMTEEDLLQFTSLQWSSIPKAYASAMS